MKLASRFPDTHDAFTILSRFGVILQDEHQFPKELVFIVQEYLTESFYRKKVRTPFVDTITYGSEHGSLLFVMTLFTRAGQVNQFQVRRNRETVHVLKIPIFQEGSGTLHCTQALLQYKAVYWQR